MTITSFTLAGPIGVDALSVSIQCAIDITKPPSFHIEGASAVLSKEIAVRVRSAIGATDLCAWPSGRVTISIDAKGAKLVSSCVLDLPIALAVAGVDVGNLLVAGELGLDGSVRPVRGVLQAALLAETLGLAGVLVPSKSAREALEAVGDATAVHAIAHLSEIKEALSARAKLVPKLVRATGTLDFADVRGQGEAIAKVEQAVSSRAGLLLSGMPGAGKTMIARRISGILPRMRRDEQIEVTRVYSALGLADGLVTDRPFRAPHHTISMAALVGASYRPGEIHLAQRGVLFLDEVAEFSRATIEVLAQTLRAMTAAERPFVVAAVNSCPCGFRDSEVRACCCTSDAVARYTAHVEWAASKLGLSIRVVVQSVSVSDLRSSPAGESSATIAARIASSAVGT